MDAQKFADSLVSHHDEFFHAHIYIFCKYKYPYFSDSKKL